MAELVEVDEFSKEELKQKIREIDSSESVWKLCKKRLYEEYNFTVEQILEISQEDDNQ